MNTQPKTDNVIQIDAYVSSGNIDYNKINEIHKQIEDVNISPSDGVYKMYEMFPNNIKNINDYVYKLNGISKPDIKKASARWLKKTSPGDDAEINSLPEYVEHYFITNGIEIGVDSAIRNKPVFIPDDASDEVENILRTENESKKVTIENISTDIENELNAIDCPKYWRSHDYIKRNVLKYISDSIDKKRLSIIQPLMISKPGYQDYTAFIDAAKIISSDNPEYVAAILYHFIWQSKRKMTGRPVHNHMMPIFTGKQDCGKSKFVNDYFLKPISGLFCGAGFSQIGDDRNVELSTNNYVIFCDEMVGASKIENNVIKNSITRETITYRPMATNASINVKNNVTFIGCTNESLSDLIRDETGARRFPIINYGNANGYDAPWKNPEFEKIDWHKLWCNVNPADESVFVTHPHLYDITMENINENKYISPFQHWMTTTDDKPNNHSPKTAKSLFELYDAYMKKYHPSSKSYGLTKFQREISDYSANNKFVIMLVNSNTKQKTYYWNKQ